MQPRDYRSAAETPASRLRRWCGGLLGAGAVAFGAQAQPAPDVPACLRVLRQELPTQPPVRAETFDRYTRSVEDLRPLIDQSSAAQPEFKLPIWDYLARLVDAKRETDGRAVLQRHAAALADIGRRHGVDASTAVAVFGVETDYGRVPGRYPVVDATLSRACLNLGSRERKAHFFAALYLLQEVLVKPDTFRGSWAGAFGLTQFMPGTFLKNMDDGDGSGDIDIVSSVPDALATTARYLNSLGWVAGLPWGVEVSVPRESAPSWNALERDHGCLEPQAPSGLCRGVAQWAAAGVRRVDGSALLLPGAGGGAPWPADTIAALLMPAGIDGPAWLVTRNFQAAWRYNRADAYALAIGLLADRLRGDPAPSTAWPTDDLALSRAEFVELQTLLLRRGHCDVTADGHDGPRTRAAIAAEEAAQGWMTSGRGGAKLLEALRAAVTQASHLPAPLPAPSPPDCAARPPG
jgi:glucose-6-phosphate 1-epimerase